MAFRGADRKQLSLMPESIEDWVHEDHLVQFVIDMLADIPLQEFTYNRRGTGSDQYDPRMMLVLLVYCYMVGIYSSRRIEYASYDNVAVRVAAANLHPDHATIAKFRRENADAVAAAFLHVLEMARAMQVWRLGTISIDGSKFEADANRGKAMTYAQSEALIARLRQEIAERLARADAADDADERPIEQLPPEVAQRQVRLAKAEAAQRQIEQQRRAAAAQARARRAALQAAVSTPPADSTPPPAPTDRAAPTAADPVQAPPVRDTLPKLPRVPKATPDPDAIVHPTDPDCRMMKHGQGRGFHPSYNAQAAVDADSQLIVGARVSQAANDQRELVATVDSVPASLGTPHTVLADAGYINEDQIRQLDDRGIDPLVATGAQRRRGAAPPGRRHTSPRLQAMTRRLATPAGQAQYARRQQTVEPVFGTIKAAMGFRRFHVRGLAGVTNEWTLVSLAYNLKRLFNMGGRPAWQVA